MTRKHGWHIFDEAVVHDVERASKFLKKLGRSCWVLDIGSSLVDVVVAAAEGKDWFYDALKETRKLFLDYALTVAIDAILAGLALTPVGWVAILAVAGAEAGVVTAFNHYAGI